MRFFLIGSLIALLFTTSCKKEGGANPQQPAVEAKLLNISYGSHERNVMDVYLPKDRTAATPFVVLIHGGGWTEGKKDDLRPFQEILLDSNIASVSISYRYVNSSTHFTELMEDVKKAIDYCIAKSDEWKIRDKKIIVAGASAGAHMALLYGYKYDTDNRLSAIISLAGPTDFAIPDFHNYAALIGLSQNINHMAGATYNFGQPIDAKFIAASPITHVINKPTLLVHGELDLVVPYDQAVRLKGKLQSLSYTHKMIAIPGAGHDLGLANPDTLKLLLKEIVAWAKAYS